MADKQKILYDALMAKNVPLGSYDLYLEKIKTSENRKKLFDVANQSGIPVGDYSRFETELNVTAAKPSNGQPSNVPSFMQSRFPSIAQPASEIPQAGRMMQRGSLVGGGAKAGNAALNVAVSPFAMADKGIREGAGQLQQMFPNSGIETGANLGLDILGLIPQIGGKIGEGTSKAYLGYAGGLLGHNLGTSPENASDIYREVPRLAGTAASILGGAELPKVAPFLKQGVAGAEKYLGERNTRMTAREFRELAPPSKSATKALQAKAYDSKIAEAVPEIQKDIKAINGKVIDKNSDIAPVEQLTDFVRSTKSRIWDEVTQKVDPIKGDAFDTKISADKTLTDVKNGLTEFQTKDLAQVESFLKEYDKPSTVGGIAKEVSRLNEETKAYEKANNEKKWEMRKTDPMLDVKVRLRDNLREDMFAQIDASGIKGVPELRKKYGAVAELHSNLLGNLEKNKGLDKKGNLFGVFQGTPIAYSLIMGAITKLATDNPMLLGVEGATAAAGMYAKQRSKPSPTSKRIVRRLQ